MSERTVLEWRGVETQLHAGLWCVFSYGCGWHVGLDESGESIECVDTSDEAKALAQRLQDVLDGNDLQARYDALQAEKNELEETERNYDQRLSNLLTDDDDGDDDLMGLVERKVAILIIDRDALQAKVSRESIDGLICDLDENEGWADDQVEAMQRLRDAILSDTHEGSN